MSNTDRCEAMQDGRRICHNQGLQYRIIGDLASARGCLCPDHAEEIAEQGKTVVPDIYE